jgi:hypothetical protein
MGISVFSVNGFGSLEIVQGFINARSQVRHPASFKHLHVILTNSPSDGTTECDAPHMGTRGEFF